jgi:hypothetical protein
MREPKRRGIRHQTHGIRNRSLTVSIPSDVDTEVRKLAARQGVSVSLVATRALQMLLTVSLPATEREDVPA